MFKKLDEVESRYEQIHLQLQDPSVTQDQKRYRGLMKEVADLEKVVPLYRKYRKLQTEIKDNRQILEKEKDEDFRQLAKEEMPRLESESAEIEEQLKLTLLPKDPNDEKNIVLEIRAGAGGDEASLFADQLFRAYCHYANTMGWKYELLSTSDGNAGGYKEVCATITGDRVYSRL